MNSSITVSAYHNRTENNNFKYHNLDKTWLKKYVGIKKTTYKNYKNNDCNYSSIHNICVCDTNNKAAEKLKEMVEPEDTVLLKGSRGMKLEEILTLFSNDKQAQWKKE